MGSIISRCSLWQVLVVIEAIAIAILAKLILTRADPILAGQSISASSDVELTFAQPSGKRTVSLEQLKRDLPVAQFTIKDPLREYQVRTYEGFWLEDLAAYAGFVQGEALTFSAIDGYEAQMPFSEIDSDPLRALLAFRQIGVAGDWEPIVEGKKQVNPAPFYLVWGSTEQGYDAKSDPTLLKRPWPHQLTRIELVNVTEEYDRLYPHGVAETDPVYQGFDLFRTLCINCHSVNLQGGAIGPELNVPRNVTEYRDRNYLTTWIKDPNTFRARNRMPAFENLMTENDIEQVIAYLRWMKDHKIQNWR